MTAEKDGLNVQAAVRAPASDDVGREQLLRYCARPCFALERLQILRTGHVAYRVKVARRGKTHRIMTPVEFLARLSALLPPPRYPLVRYHGVLAPHSKLRVRVVPRAPEREPKAPSCGRDERTGGDGCRAARSSPAVMAAALDSKVPGAERDGPAVQPLVASRRGGEASSSPGFRATTERNDVSAAIANGRHGCGSKGPSPAPAPEAAGAVQGVLLTHQGISVQHLDRLLGGDLLAEAPRIPWAQLLRRTYGFDVHRCRGCGGRLRLLSAIADSAVARAILTQLGLPSDAPRARGRDPTIVHDDLEEIWSDGA